MSVEEIKSNIKSYILKNCDVKSEVNLDSEDMDILAMGIVDSISVVQYLAFLEEEYDIDLIEEDMNIEDVVNINKLSRLIYNKTEGDSRNE